MKNDDTVILCEKCVKSENCMILRPCKDFLPEQSTNFFKEVALIKPEKEEERFVL